MKKYTLTTFKTGLRLIMVPMPQMESVSVMVGVGAGSRYETKKINGLFHFLEHMAFKGTKKRPTTLAIASEIDQVGGLFNAFTSKELTGYWIKLAVKHKTLAFDILSDILTNSLLQKKEIDRERGVIIEEINMYEDLPMRKVYENFERLLYGDNSMGWQIGGEKETVRQIKQEDFLTCLKKLYYPENMVLAVAGKIKSGEVKGLTSQFFSQLQKAGQKKTKEIKISQLQARLNLVTKKTEQGHFCLGVPGYQYSHPDRFAIGVLAAILGGGMSSRLFIEIRERRGLAYYVDCQPEFFTDSGYLMARAGVKLAKIDEAIKVVLAEFNNVATALVVGKELKKAKELLKGRMILALEDSRNVVERYAAQLLLEKKIRTPQQAMTLIDKVTPDDIQRVARAVFKPEKLNLAIIGPYKAEGRFRKLLKNERT
ncbi:MAG TPA: pitrilysin family protein [Nevskiaceae bacterium]|nr:pitrilysin family protein [Nevskiaceae bacterium]